MKNTLRKAARCLLFTILATVTPLARSVVYVDGAAAGLENGTSWANAYKDLRAAMAASPANAEIWVAKGTYKPGPSRADSFVLKPGMKLYGFTGIQDGPAVRQAIMDHPRRPKGKGWGIEGYALIDSATDPKRISYE